MAAPASKIAGEVQARARGLEAYVGRMERLAARGELGASDLHRVYSGAFLSFHTYLERSIERLFLGLLMGRLTKADVSSLVSIKSDAVARAVIVGGRGYVDWLPLERFTVPRAKAFLSRGKPFSDVPRADRRALERLGVIRNAIAHESAHALRRFGEAFTEGRALPPAQRAPAGYLRGQHTVGVTRFSYHLAETVAVVTRLCA